ncbi:hypothetical protein Rt10032_c02g1132 [Rhodotorula toruloides]|uniref:CBM20 domain-containing protein n=1 Tax=Rhodotorula toruloides TaxID=5286 RepID=A0A511KAV6_RHOTO|nr:hypothetical protein Rt10032_c02g1132 [Rhodotorula toruloides]
MSDTDPLGEVLFFHLNLLTNLAQSSEYIEINQAVEQASHALAKRTSTDSDLKGRPWLEAHYRLTLALAYYRLYRDQEAAAEVERAGGLVDEVMQEGRGDAGLVGRLREARELVRAERIEQAAVVAETPTAEEDVVPLVETPMETDVVSRRRKADATPETSPRKGAGHGTGRAWAAEAARRAVSPCPQPPKVVYFVARAHLAPGEVRLSRRPPCRCLADKRMVSHILKLAGSVPELGEWQLASALTLDKTGDGDVFEAACSISLTGLRGVTFKLVKVAQDGTAIWEREGRGNRELGMYSEEKLEWDV